MADEDEPTNTNPTTKCTPKARNFIRGAPNANTYKYHHHHHHHLLQNPYGLGCTNQYQIFQGLLPLPPSVSPYFSPNQMLQPRAHFKMAPRRWDNFISAPPSDSKSPDIPVVARVSLADVEKKICLPSDKRNAANIMGPKPDSSYSLAKRPDTGGVEGRPITLLANHFLVKFDQSQKIFQYDVEISPNPSKELARLIKHKLVEENPEKLSNAHPVYDGRRTIYSPIEFQNEKLEFHVSLPVEKISQSLDRKRHDKIFRVNIKLVSKLEFKGYDSDFHQLPQECIHALDVVLRENPNEKCLSNGQSFYSSLMGGAKEIGGGAIALRGFFQSLRPTQRGLSLNVDFSVTAFHESIGVIPYLKKRLHFMHDIVSQNTARILTGEEKKEIERVLKNMRVFVSHRETLQRYRVYGLTEEITENLWFTDRDGTRLKLVSYFKDHYEYDMRYTNLPCLQVSRRRPCYLPLELCAICEGQKFLGKLSDDQTVKLLKMGCQRPRERKKIIDSVMEGQFGPTSGHQGRDFKLDISTEMMKLTGRILEPPKLKLGNTGHVRNLTPYRHDRQWNLLDSHVVEGTHVEHWAVISFGGTREQKCTVLKFINRLSQRCEQLGISLQKNTVIAPLFEPMHILGSPKLLETKLRQIHRAAFGNLQLLVCVMERKHRGYADLKRIAETSVGFVSQCCLYSNVVKMGSQFLSNLALKINAKVGGSTVALHDPIPSEIPRIFGFHEPSIFMGADVTHPHPSDDFSPSVAAVVGSLNWPAPNRYVSRMRSQTHRQEIIKDLTAMVKEILEDFAREVSKLPERIVFFRDGVSETQFRKVLEDELSQIREACSRFTGYGPRITFVVVQKRHHTRLFPADGEGNENENVPPGTVVDSAVVGPSGFDFYLCSHWGARGTSRPVRYNVLWDENGFTSDEVQRLVYGLCYTFVRCTGPVSVVPPVYYAHLAAYRGRLYADRAEGSGSCGVVSRAVAPEVAPLPRLSDSVRKLMFYC
ncbi:Protein argonaute 1 [Striga hermonthica]|uniref:Protein argonaute 1 n=1 Tax=Striga hermonthica TaxID=68872 RepID=A0A9N7NFH9_STRHE|nr:Protein argonaute 1 [Striga hermonthica]